MSGQRRFLKVWARTVGMPVGITDEEVSGATDQGLNMFQQLRNQITAPIKQLPQLPNVQPIQSSTDPMSQERLDFAEQVAGRPVI